MAALLGALPDKTLVTFMEYYSKAFDEDYVVDEQLKRPRHYGFVPIVIIFLSLPYTAVGLRIWTRTHFVKIVGWDDWFILISVMCFTIYCSSVIGMFHLAGDARAISTLDYPKVRIVVNLLLVSELFYILTMMALKLSLALFFFRIMVMRWQRWIILASITASTVFGVAYFFFAIFQCGWFSNIDMFIGRIVQGKCANKSVGLGMNYTYASLATISDWVCGLIPIFILRESTMLLKAKLIVCGLMFLAAVGWVASIVRMCYLFSITVPTGDFFIKINNLAIWTTIEPAVGITVASLATLRPLLSYILERRRRRASQQSRHSTQKSSEGNHLEKAPEKATAGDSSETTIEPTSPDSSYDKTTEKVADIEKDMRAYGMTNFEECTSVSKEDLETFVPFESELPSLFGNQRVCMSPDLEIQN